MEPQPQTAKQIFDRAVEIDSRALRDAYVEQACAGSPQLKQRVEALLRAYENSGSFLEAPQTEVAADPETLAQTRHDERPGSVIGPYKLLQQLGEGGMGTVFMAEQAQPVQRRVALKIIKAGMDSRQVIARFAAEQHALALMDHPHIARVLDAGTTASGRPYFVMELVKGVPITQFCDEHQLTPRQRLELFIPVCQAVQHAHQKGIVHRDLKPSNVLIARYDEKAVAKVIDFGVAKALGRTLTDKSLFTEFGQMLGTVEYMSPEQAGLNQLDIDTRSDIYSLGVLLYELLTGSTPLEHRRVKTAALLEVLRLVREEEAPKPSTRLSSTDQLPSISAKRGLEPKKLSLLVRGDLDWIVMKALEKDRGRRYETANGLSIDVQRYLAGEAVFAAPPSKAYRLKKFVQRNRGAVLASAAVIIVLIAGVIGTTIGLIGQARQRRIADQQRAAALTQEQEAKRQAAIASAVGEFQSEMLASADPANLLGDKVTVLQAVTAAVKELDGGKLKDQPLVEAKVRETIGMTFRALGRFDAAEPNLRKALELRRSAVPADPQSVAYSLNSLGRLMSDIGNVADAETLYAESLKLRQNAVPSDDSLIAASLNNLATVLFAQGKHSQAEQRFREALAINRKFYPAGHQQIATSLNNLAIVLRDQGKFAESEPLFREALDTYRRALPAGHLNIASATDNLAALLQVQGRVAEADPLIREALAIRRHALPAGHPDLAGSLNNLAMLLYDQKKYAESEVLAREALSMTRTAMPGAHPNIAAGLGNVANILNAQGKNVEAEALYRESLDMRRKLLPANHPEIALALNGIAGVLAAQRKFEEAEQLFRQSLAICLQSLPDPHPDTAQTQKNLGVALVERGALAEAEQMYRASMAGFVRVFDENHPRVTSMRVELGLLLTHLDRFGEAEAALIRAEQQLAGPNQAESSQQRCIKGLVNLYARWDQAEPGKGHAAKADQWKAREATTTPTSGT